MPHVQPVGPAGPASKLTEFAYQPPRSWNGLHVAVELQAAAHLATRTNDDGHTIYEFFDPQRDGAPTVTLDERVCGWANHVADEAAPDDPMMRLHAVHQSVNDELAGYDDAQRTGWL